MKEEKAQELREKLGLTEEDIRDIGTVYINETWPRIEQAIRLRKLNKGKGIRFVVRKIPWPHIDPYNALVRRIATAETKAELKAEILEAKEQVIRRIVANSVMFNFFGHPELDKHLWPTRAVAKPRWPGGRDRIADLMQVGDDAEPDAYIEFMIIASDFTRDMPLWIKQPNAFL